MANKKDESGLTRTEDIINAWMADNKQNCLRIGLKLKDIFKDFILLKVGGYTIQVTVPFGLDGTRIADNTSSSIVALPLQEEQSESLMETILALNDKLEIIAITPNWVVKVLDTLQEIFHKYRCVKPKYHLKLGEPTEQNFQESYIYRSVQGFNKELEKLQVSTIKNTSSFWQRVLPFCSVRLIPSMKTVEIKMDISRVMCANRAVTSLQFSLKDPLRVYLCFDSITWSRKEFIPLHMIRSLRVVVGKSQIQSKEFEVSMKNALAILGTGYQRYESAIINGGSIKLRPYGPNRLVPDVFSKFLQTFQIGNDNSLIVQGEVNRVHNILICGSIFLGCSLATVQSRCFVCRRPLPHLSRFWSCQKDLCLYMFEELGVGASVLQELQYSELIDLEITFAAAAARCTTRDVFEPYPSFLLKKREIRKRSGFFSNYISGESAVTLNAIKSGESTPKEAGNPLNNKSLHILRQIFESFPPLSEIQQCSSEIELVVKLGTSWLQKKSDSDRINQTDVAHGEEEEDYAENIWLPYNILRYVLLTNRLSFHLLPEGNRFNAHKSLYQFAIFYNSESELIFEERRKTEGSLFAFHGSPLWNWYSIIRNGLRCLTDTSYMDVGKDHGVGIYLSKDLITCFRYSGRDSHPWTLNSKRKDYLVIALCEVLSGGNYESKEDFTMLVVPPHRERDIILRYLFVFDKGDERTVGKRVKQNSGWLMITEDGYLTPGNINLYEHYKLLRQQHAQEVLK